MNTQGIGLGLVISENIVKAFDGQIGVESKFGEGSAFVFSFLLEGKDGDDSEGKKYVHRNEELFSIPTKNTFSKHTSIVSKSKSE